MSSSESKTKIFIVEDELRVAGEIANTLELLGYSVSGTAASGEETLEKFMATLPDLVLMDIQLQGEMDGVATAARIRSLADIPVIYLTASKDLDSVNRAILTEPFGYIVKPVHVPTLRSTMETALYKHRMERRLRRSEELLGTILSSISDAVIATGTDSSITFMNPVAESLTGWSQDEAVGRPFAEVFRIISEKGREPIESLAEKVLAAGHNVNLSSRTVLISREGRERIIADSGSPIRDKEGRITGSVLVFRDITDNVKMEEDLLKAQKLESIGILAGGIAHDFNNLLTAILGNISLAKMFTAKEDKIRQKLAEAEKASLRARDLTHQLLTFSRGGAPVRKASQLTGIIKDSAVFTLSGSRVICHFDIPCDLWPAEVDEGQISQVLGNLIINADQAMADGGAITIKCANIQVGSENALPLREGRYIRISISDQGVGIPEENLPRIFDPYFTTKKTGKGLGLAMVYSIIRNHDGHIMADSTEGVGTTFTIYLPATESVSVERLEHAKEPAAARGKILLMDDEEKIRDVAAEILRLTGYEVDLARDGDEAVALYKKADSEMRPYAAVIMDLTIPGGMGGKEAIETLRAIDESVIAIVSSGYSNDPIMADYKTYGFSGVISKPYMASDLRSILDDVLKGAGVKSVSTLSRP
jgi:two-component system, cell cycle sensor histidine kinase and response regulator CckA